MKIIKYFICLLIPFIQLGCQHEEILLNRPRDFQSSLKAYLENNSDYTLFSYALQRTGLLDTLDNEGKYTVLALKNSVLEASGLGSKDAIDSIALDILKADMYNHIIPKAVDLDNIPIEQYDLQYKTLSNNLLQSFSIKVLYPLDEKYSLRNFINPSDIDKLITFSGSAIVNKLTKSDSRLAFENEGNYQLTNGYIHNIHKPIKIYPNIDLHTYLLQNSSYSIFVTFLKHFGYWNKINNYRNFTLFAPTNITFETLGLTEAYITSLDASKYNVDLLLGSYFIQDMQHYLADFTFFLNKENQYWLRKNINKDSPYFQIITPVLFQNNTRFAYYGLEEIFIGVSHIPTPPSYFNESSGTLNECARFLGFGAVKENNPSGGVFNRFCTAKTGNSYNCDIKLKNGIIHELEGLLVLPENAKLN